MAAGPTERTLKRCRELGYMACVVEKWIPQTRQRKDAFGFGDVLAVTDEPGALLIQATSTPNMSARERKIREECGGEARRWLEQGNRIEVWGWAKRGPAGKRKLWTLRRVRLLRIGHDAESIEASRARPGDFFEVEKA